MKWSEAEKQGIRRCCAMFNNGKRCRRRADDQGLWCEKHRPIFDSVKEWTDRVVKLEKNRNDHT